MKCPIYNDAYAFAQLIEAYIYDAIITGYYGLELPVSSSNPLQALLRNPKHAKSTLQFRNALATAISYSLPEQLTLASLPSHMMYSKHY